jgi:hypothetical protein
MVNCLFTKKCRAKRNKQMLANVMPMFKDRAPQFVSLFFSSSNAGKWQPTAGAVLNLVARRNIIVNAKSFTKNPPRVRTVQLVKTLI